MKQQSSESAYEVIVVGGGPAGLCAAMYAGRGIIALQIGLPAARHVGTRRSCRRPDHHEPGRKRNRQENRPHDPLPFAVATYDRAGFARSSDDSLKSGP